jgi:phthalate 4,5-dioxygenase oxygenase subunit
MLSHEENELLCRVGPTTPMGRMLRRYWVPALLSEELKPNYPKRVELFGETLVAFRDDAGAVGLLDEACPHRGASLVLAHGEDCGLRCLYHGWKIDRDGQIVDMPSEPSDSTFRERIRATAYSTYEAGGMIWAYLGPSGLEPPRLDFEWTTLPSEQVLIMKSQIACNWLQGYEGAVDSCHTNYLHRDSVAPAATGPTTVLRPDASLERPSNDGAPQIEIEDTPYGYRYAAIRKPLQHPEAQRYIRISLFVAPFYSMFPAPDGWSYTQIFVPMDDKRIMWYYVQATTTSAFNDEKRALHRRRAGVVPGIDVDSEYRRARGRENDWLQDRDAMALGKSFSGLPGINAEDMAVTESMGTIYDRTKEHLGTSDGAVIRLRRMLLESVRRFERDEALPLGLAGPVDYRALHAIEGMLPVSEHWSALSRQPVHH